MSGGQRRSRALEHLPNQPLFRREALAERENRFGNAIAWVPQHESVLAWMLCVGLAVGSVALGLVEYSEKITVYGTAEQQRAPITVFSPRPGVVKQVSVFEGEWVHAGAVLLRLDTSLRKPDGRKALSVTADSLRDRLAAVSHEDAEIAALARLDVLRLRSERASLERETLLAGRRADLLRQQHAVARENEESVSRLYASRNASKHEVGKARSLVLQAESSVVAHMALQQQLERDIGELAHNQEVQVRQLRLARLRAAKERARLQADLDALLASEELALVAPVAGRVTNLFAHSGLQASLEQPLVTLVDTEQDPSSGGVTDVVLHVPSRAAGRIEPGMDLQLRFTGFPIQQYGLVTGSIIQVGDVALRSSSEPVFRIRARIEPPSFIDEIPHGMQVEADVHIERKPLWRWLVAPAQSAIARL